jgi:hypothetical protein
MDATIKTVDDARRRILTIFRMRKSDACHALAEGPIRKIVSAFGWSSDEVGPIQTIGTSSECVGFMLGGKVGVVVVRGTAVSEPRSAMRKLFAFFPMHRCFVADCDERRDISDPHDQSRMPAKRGHVRAPKNSRSSMVRR